MVERNDREMGRPAFSFFSLSLWWVRMGKVSLEAVKVEAKRVR